MIQWIALHWFHYKWKLGQVRKCVQYCSQYNLILKTLNISILLRVYLYFTMFELKHIVWYLIKLTLTQDHRT